MIMRIVPMSWNSGQCFGIRVAPRAVYEFRAVVQDVVSDKGIVINGSCPRITVEKSPEETWRRVKVGVLLGVLISEGQRVGPGHGCIVAHPWHLFTMRAQ
eukprot:4043314-Lingulodinium_polyedra.AAC.1